MFGLPDPWELKCPLLDHRSNQTVVGSLFMNLPHETFSMVSNNPTAFAARVLGGDEVIA